jgi:hypothetical protein
MRDWSSGRAEDFQSSEMGSIPLSRSMSECYKCGICEDYTDQFAVLQGGKQKAACWPCFKALGCPKNTQDVDELKQCDIGLVAGHLLPK